MKFLISGDVPDQLCKAFMQHLRDFDANNPGCHFGILVDAPGSTIDEMNDILDVSPSFQFRKMVRRPP